MNEAQKIVLQRHIKQLADDIIITEELLSMMFQRRIFERSMIEAIKAEKTHTEQLYKMLNMLPRRGPDAFDSFIDIIKSGYPWLAATLEMNYKAESEMLHRQGSSATLLCTCGSATFRTEVDGQKPPAAPIEVQADPDVKTKVGTFIHKQFGQSKRISQHDKKSMEKWLSEQIQSERKKLTSASISEEPDNCDQESSTSPTPDVLQADIKRVFEKVRDENLSDLLNSEHNNIVNETDVDRASDEIDAKCESKPEESSEKLVTYLESEVDKLINRMNHMEGMITQCHYILGDPDRKYKLSSLVKDVQTSYKHLEKDLNKERVKSEKMLHEIYDYSKSIHKLENDKLHQRYDIDRLSAQIEELKRQNAVFADKCQTLEIANFKHLEKEKTLQSLQKMVDDLKTSHTALVDENSNNRINYGTAGNFRSFRRPNRMTSRRGSNAELTMANMTRKPATKPSQTTTRKKTTTTSKTS